MSDHATWSASSTERNWECAGSLALTVGLPETTSQAADWGTCCHVIAEDCLFDRKKSADQFIGQTVKGKSHSFEVDDEMADTAQMYIDYCWGRVDEYKKATGKNALRFVEEKFSLEKLGTPFDAGGTSDHVLIFEDWNLIEVVDLKGGRGVVVEVVGNKQERSYGLGAVLRHEGLDLKRVMVTIVQPRAPHKDGRIRSEEFHISELVEWTTDLLAAMRRSKAAVDTLPQGAVRIEQHEEVDDADKPTGRMIDVAVATIPPAWAGTYLCAGDHCRFCKAKAFCPAIETKTMQTIGAWFDPSGLPQVPVVRSDDDPVKRGQKLDLLDMMEGWIAAYREDEHRRAEAGDPAENYVLVPAQKRETWNDGAEDKVLAAAKAAGLPPAKYLNPAKLRTPKQVRKELGAKADLVADLSSTPSGGTNLVRATKTTRAPVLGTATRFFEPQA
jgi:hypothetical protein